MSPTTKTLGTITVIVLLLVTMWFTATGSAPPGDEAPQAPVAGPVEPAAAPATATAEATAPAGAQRVAAAPVPTAGVFFQAPALSAAVPSGLVFSAGLRLRLGE